MTEITWTVVADDYQYQPVLLNMNQDGASLHLVREYQYLTPDRELKPIYMDSALIQDIPWVDIPVDIQNALIFIDNYTKDQIRIQTEHIVSGSPL